MSELYSSSEEPKKTGKPSIDTNLSTQNLTKRERALDSSLASPALDGLEKRIDDKALTSAACACSSCTAEVTRIASFKVGNVSKTVLKRQGVTRDDLVRKTTVGYFDQANEERIYKTQIRVWENQKGKGKGKGKGSTN